MRNLQPLSIMSIASCVIFFTKREPKKGLRITTMDKLINQHSHLEGTGVFNTVAIIHHLLFLVFKSNSNHTASFILLNSNSNMTFIVLNLHQKTDSKVQQPSNMSKDFIVQRHRRVSTPQRQ